MWLLGLAVTAFALIAPWWAVAAVRRQRRELRAMRERLDLLETRVSRSVETLATPPPALAAHQEPALESLPRHIPAAPAVTTPPGEPASPTTVPLPARARGFDSSRAEELIGSVWLQNIGAVLLLLGVFFLILWGYTTGRFGPGALVVAGVALAQLRQFERPFLGFPTI